MPEPVDEQPDDPARLEDAAASTASLDSGRTRRFCGRCGAPLAVDASACPRCDRPEPSESSPSADDQDEVEAVRSPRPVADVIGLYGVLLVTFLPIAIGAWIDDGDGEISVGYEITVGVIDAVIIGVWAIARWATIGPLLMRAVSLGWLVAPIAIGWATFLISWVFVDGVTTLFGIEEIVLTDGYARAGFGLVVMILFTCVQPAVFEELAFRGIIFNGLLSFLTRRETVIVSAVMFMVVHLTAFGVPQLVLGLVLAWLRLRSGSLWPCILLHFTHNFLCLSLELWWS